MCTGAEIFTTFTSVTIIAKQVSKVVDALINKATGRRTGGAASEGVDTPEVDMGGAATAGAATCASCFNCKV